MSFSKRTNWIIAASLTAFLCGTSAETAAHSSIDIPNGEVLEGYMTKVAYRIQHACSESGRPVIAQSFLLPTVNPILSRADGGEIPDLDGNGTVDLSDVIQGGSLVGLIQPYIDTTVFKQRQRKTDANGNAIGFSSTKGNVPDGFYAEIPFLLPSVFFVETSCVMHLLVHPVGADVCKITRTPRLGDANIWMEHTTARFPNNVHGIGQNELRIDFKRDTGFNPLPKGCGEGFTVEVHASEEDIDANLPITIPSSGYWPH